MGDTIVGVRHRLFDVPGFEVLANYQGVCEDAQILREMPGQYSVDEAAQACADMDVCSYFTLSTVVGLEGVPGKYANTAWLCQGSPTFSAHLGWLAGGKIGRMPPRLPVLGTLAFNGPLPV